jgi:hypothetical protein
MEAALRLLLLPGLKPGPISEATARSSWLKRVRAVWVVFRVSGSFAPLQDDGKDRQRQKQKQMQRQKQIRGSFPFDKLRVRMTTLRTGNGEDRQQQWQNATASSGENLVWEEVLDAEHDVDD